MNFLSGLIGHVVSGASGGLLGILGSGLHAWLAIQQQKATIEGIKVEAGTKIRIASYRTGPIIAWAHLGVTALLLGTTLSFLWWTPGAKATSSMWSSTLPACLWGGSWGPCRVSRASRNQGVMPQCPDCRTQLPNLDAPM